MKIPGAGGVGSSVRGSPPYGLTRQVLSVRKSRHKASAVTAERDSWRLPRPEHAAPFLVLLPHRVSIDAQMWPPATCPQPAAAPGCQARCGGGGRSLPAQRRAPAAIFGSLLPGRAGSRGARRPSCGRSAGSRDRRRPATAADREGAWHGAAGPSRARGADRQSRRSWWCGGGSLGVGGAEPAAG